MFVRRKGVWLDLPTIIITIAISFSAGKGFDVRVAPVAGLKPRRYMDTLENKKAVLIAQDGL
jgi:hypothetical protein